MARNRPKHVEKIGVTEISPVISYLQKHGIGAKEVEKAWKSAGGLDALVRFTRRRLSGGVSFTRKSLEEIREEVELVESCQAVKKAWEEFCGSGSIPDLASLDYGGIFDSVHTKDEYEPDDELKKEMVALSLTDQLLDPILLTDAYGHRWKIWASAFVRVVISHQKEHTTWNNVAYVLKPIREIIPQRKRVPEIIDRLQKRLSRFPDDLANTRVQKIILEPLQKALNLTTIQTSILSEATESLINGSWHTDLNNTVDTAVEKLEDMQKSLPNPREVPCIKAIRRVVEIFESGQTAVNTLEDAAILEHIQDYCGKHCRVLGLEHCIDTTLFYGVVRKWDDEPDDYVPKIIEKAKNFLANNK